MNPDHVTIIYIGCMFKYGIALYMYIYDLPCGPLPLVLEITQIVCKPLSKSVGCIVYVYVFCTYMHVHSNNVHVELT